MLNTITLLTAIVALSANQVRAEPVQAIQQNGQCLGITGAPAIGSPVSLQACNSENIRSAQRTGQQWEITRGVNAGIQLFGTNLCLAASALSDGAPVNVDVCAEATNIVSPLIWYYTDDSRIAITMGTRCLFGSSGQATITQCAPGIAQQAFTADLLFDTTVATGLVATAVYGSGSQTATGAQTGLNSLSSVASSIASAASSALSGTSVVGGAGGIVGTSAGASAASSLASGASSGVAGASASLSSIIASATNSANSVVSSASASAASVVSGASASASGAAGAAGSATSRVGSAVSSGANAASSAVSSVIPTRAIGHAVSNNFNAGNAGLVLVAVAIGAMMV